ncbi:MAG: hypothetical protein JWQ08_492 [Deinococcus sp.]|nr:hypothetical protein [Deinococcus sp.]
MMPAQSSLRIDTATTWLSNSAAQLCGVAVPVPLIEFQHDGI